MEARLLDWFRQQRGVLVAFSGGVDSALVASLAREGCGRSGMRAVVSDSPSLKRRDLALARDFCEGQDIELVIVQTQELEDEAYAANPVNRCFHCKTELYQELRDVARDFPGWVVVNGSNVDDVGDYRPGLAAARDFSVASPLMAFGVGKEQVRALARQRGLPVWDKPASPCLASRIAYGQRVTREKLQRIEAAEAFLLEQGFREVRVRHLGETASVEVPADAVDHLREIAPHVESTLRSLGFAEVRLDAEGLVSGKLNRAIGIGTDR